jgi:hypothetical protein
MAPVLRKNLVHNFQYYVDTISTRITSAAHNLNEVLPPGSELERAIALGEFPSVEQLRKDLLRPRLTFVCVTAAEAEKIVKVGFSARDKGPPRPVGNNPTVVEPQGRHQFQVVRRVRPRRGLHPSPPGEPRPPEPQARGVRNAAWPHDAVLPLVG